MINTSTSAVVRYALTLLTITFLYGVFSMLGATALAGMMPTDSVSEAGLVSKGPGFLIIAVANSAIIMALILCSRRRDPGFVFFLALAYYGAVTFVMQIETWYFLSGTTVSSELLPRLFVMGVPTAFFLIPASVWVVNRVLPHSAPACQRSIRIPIKQFCLRALVVVVLYLLLYFLAGYYIAWMNPELRAFYGHPGDAIPFWAHMSNLWADDRGLFLFQAMRSQIWLLCALPVIYASRNGPLGTALLVGLFLSVPQSIVHIIENPLLPLASVRFSHLIETASSNFVFGILIVWLFQAPKH